MATIDEPLFSYYRCPAELASFTAAEPHGEPGFFRLGEDILCYGHCSGGAQPAWDATAALNDARPLIQYDAGTVRLPFSPAEVVDNLRHERYFKACSFYQGRLSSNAAIRAAYYLIRKFLPVAVRKHLQRACLKDARSKPFPAWPIDTTVDRLMESLLALSLKARGMREIPFIWFWPDGRQSCVLMTHDVETIKGRDFAPTLMELNRSRGIPASFQVVPESRYPVPESFLQSIRDGGCEVNVHDLNHDGHLYSDRNEFRRRVARINGYGKAFGAEGFRAGALYRNLDWYGELDFAYDMSVPSAGHLEPQAGGCCTVMPYFVGELLEIPVTATQDYSLFHILQQYSIELWKSEIETLMRAHGLISFIAHPDYLIEKRARSCYMELLDHLAELRSQGLAWITLPKQLNNWWRERSQMSLVRGSNGWTVTGPGSERASVAYAFLDGDRLAYRIAKPSPEKILAA